MILSEEHRLIQETARSFVADRVAPEAAAWDAEERFPAEAIKGLGELGLMGMLAHEVGDEDGDGGGSGIGYLAFALVVEEIAAGDASLSTILSVHNGVGTLPIQDHGSDVQKARWLPRLTTGDALGGFALSEPQAGSDASNIRTKASRTQDGWVLNGTKAFITSGSTADVLVVFARTGEGKGGLSAFVVPTDEPGFHVVSKERKMGQRASDTCQIAFDDLHLPEDALLGEEGQGYSIALGNLEGGRIGIAAQSVGLARAALEAATAYAKEREAFGAPISSHQAVAFRLADMATEVEAARALTLQAAVLKDSGAPALKLASMAKLFASEVAERVCSAAVQIHGGYGYLADFAVERIYRDQRVCQIYEGTSDVQKMVISRAVLDGR
ncbi:MAG: acyl-CoA dehydrogenase family protein [Magnetovibrionaceae bacterium]